MTSCMHLKKEGGWTFRTVISVKGWRVTEPVRKKLKEGKTKYSSKMMCIHSKWANDQTLKTELGISCMQIKMIHKYTTQNRPGSCH